MTINDKTPLLLRSRRGMSSLFALHIDRAIDNPRPDPASRPLLSRYVARMGTTLKRVDSSPHVADWFPFQIFKSGGGIEHACFEQSCALATICLLAYPHSRNISRHELASTCPHFSGCGSTCAIGLRPGHGYGRRDEDVGTDFRCRVSLRSVGKSKRER